MVIDYVCVCYGMCYKPKDLEAWHKLSNTNRTEKNVFQRNPFFMFYLTFVLYLVTALFGTTANILVIVGLLWIMKDKSVVNRFVVSLAAADLFLSVIITPVKLLYLMEVMKYMRITWLCKILLHLRQMAQAEAIVILTIIAFERYYAICHPLKAKFRCSMRRCHILILISWVASLIMTLPTVLAAVIRTMIGLLIVFIVCWGPRLSYNVINVFYLGMLPITRYYADMLVELLANTHSLVNPVMFILFSQ
ncbi:QRFP-like peptide receptor [Liolophura sinensis]|uniref:QRFP-like peptide receptor n=1 Tax=Liolophura sinensis TaxID=3198878 RepID=UPI003158C11E